jgi:hypothetical protein
MRLPGQAAPVRRKQNSQRGAPTPLATNAPLAFGMFAAWYNRPGPAAEASGMAQTPPVLASACYGRSPVTGAARKPLRAWTGDDRRAPLGPRKARAVLIERRIWRFGDEVEVAG